MAAILQIENYDESDYVDLLDSTKIDLILSTNPFKISKIDPLRTRSFQFYVTGADDVEVRTNFNELLEILQRASDWKDDDLLADSVWLREAPDNTPTNVQTRQLITNWDVLVNSTRFHDPLQAINSEAVVTLTITTQKELEFDDEEVATCNESVTSSGSAIGQLFTTGIYPWTGSTQGTEDARISVAGIDSSDKLHKVWMGIKAYRHGYDAYFDPVVKIEDGTVLGGSLQTETGSYGTQVGRWRFSDESELDTMSPRWFSNIAYDKGVFNENAKAFTGEYMAIMRYKVMSGAIGQTFAARLGTTFSVYYSQGAAYNDIQFLESDGNWRLINMGKVKFPPRGYRQLLEDVSDPMRTATLILEMASLDTGEGVFIDTITLVPYDHFISVEECNLSGNKLNILTHENGDIESVEVNTVLVEAYPRVTASNSWAIPYSDGFNTTLLVIAGEGVNVTGDYESDVSDSFTAVSLDVFRRWKYFHG